MRTVRFNDGTYVFAFDVELDHAGTDKLTAALSALPSARCIVDLTNVAFVDRSGATRLANAARGRRLSIVTHDPRTVRLLASVDRSVPVHALLSDALGA
jgi:anti-anti-sigma regulatory factor